jgi:hypothetical protein
MDDIKPTLAWSWTKRSPAKNHDDCGKDGACEESGPHCVSKGKLAFGALG